MGWVEGRGGYGWSLKGLGVGIVSRMGFFSGILSRILSFLWRRDGGTEGLEAFSRVYLPPLLCPFFSSSRRRRLSGGIEEGWAVDALLHFSI